jgi:hypothetical protein
VEIVDVIVAGAKTLGKHMCNKLYNNSSVSREGRSPL